MKIFHLNDRWQVKENPKIASKAYRDIRFNRFFCLALCGIFVFLSVFSSPVNVSALSETNYPVMRITSEQRALLNDKLLSMPEAVIDR